MIEKVISAINTFDMIKPEESLLCCLSGGADSVALLICLHELSYNVKACHINHNLRGEESDRDELFCRELCRKLGIKLEVHSIDVKSYAAEHKMGTEQAARIMRYDIFERTDCDRICTAHTLSDATETLLFNLARGTGLKGLSSIPAVRGRIIRPLIECSREDIEQFLTARGQDWVTDSTNLTDEYNRNKIRHNVIPALKGINPSLEKTLRGTLDNLREDSAFIEAEADRFYAKAKCGKGLDISMLSEASPAISGRAIRKLCAGAGHDCSRSTVGYIRELCSTGGKLTLGYGLYCCVKDNILTVEKEEQLVPDTAITVSGAGEYSFFEKNVEIKILDKGENDGKFHRFLTYCTLDYDKIKGEIVIRNRRAGDKIKLAGRQHTSDLRKLMQSKLSRADRGRCVLLSDSEGVIAAEGFGIADRVKVTEKTKTVLFCKISSDCHNDGI